MRITNLTHAYRTHILKGSDAGAYEASHPAFFDHYHSFWSHGRNSYPRLPETDLDARNREVLEFAPSIESSLASCGAALDEIDLVLVVGSGTANGHAFKSDGRFAAWLALECFDDPVTLKTFLAHEIAHALHYSSSPGFYFANADERIHVGRQVISEGIATRLSMLAADVNESTSLWGAEDCDAWLSSCRASCTDLRSQVVRTWSDSPRDNGLFTMREGSHPAENRGGYYVGLHIVMALERRYAMTVIDLARMSRSDLERMFLEELAA